MQKLTKILVLVVCIGVASFAYPQELTLKADQININHGLSHNSVYSIIQDNEGFIWFATQNGLDRYDGITIKTYKHDPVDTNSLSSNNFGKIYQDKEGIFWLGTFGGGLNKYDPFARQFTHYRHNPDDSTSISNDRIQFLYEDSKEILWIGTYGGGLNAFDKKTEKFTRYLNNLKDPNSISSNHIKTIAEDQWGNLWIGTRQGLNRFDRNTRKFKHYKHDPNNKNSLCHDNVNSIIIDTSMIIWIATRGGGLDKFNIKTGKFQNFYHEPNKMNSLSENKIEYLLRDSYGNVWLGTYSKGLDKMDPATGEITNYPIGLTGNDKKLSERIEYLFEDRSHILWIATRGGGVKKMDLKPQKFRTIDFDPDNRNKIPHPNVKAIDYDGNEHLWIGTDGGGVAQYSIKKQKIVSHFVNDPKNKNSLNDNRIMSILVENENTIWIGTLNSGLDRLTIQKNSYVFEHYEHEALNPSSLSNNQVNNIFIDHEKNLWIGTQVGVNRMVKNNDGSVSFIQYKHPRFKTSISTNYITTIFEDSNHNLWIGTYDGGLNRYNHDDESFTHYTEFQINDEKININRVLSIFEDRYKQLWIGTEGDGLLQFFHKNNQFVRYLNHEAPKSSTILSIQDDVFGNLWISTTDGISRFNTRNKRFKNYTISDGLNTHGFNANSSIIDEQGNIYFGSTDGITITNPKSIIDNLIIPPIAITDIMVFNQSIYKEHANLRPFSGVPDDYLEFTHKDMVISVEFAALDFSVPEKNEYKYKMEGLEDKWIDIGTHRYINFIKLKPGKYALTIIGSNNDGIWNNQGKKIELFIKPPLWKSRGFILLEIVIVLTLILLFIYFNEKRLQKDKQNLEQAIVERTKEIQNQKEELQSQTDSLAKINKELEEYSVILRETDNAVSVMDSKGDYQWINEGFTRLYGYSLEELINDKGRRRIGSNSNLKVKDLINIWFGDKKTIIYESQNLTKSGNKIWAQTTLTPVLNSDNQVEKLIAIDADISKIKDAEEIIIRKNQDITDSIEYAKRIQQAMLPPYKIIENAAADNFIINIPKEIISGDFYWAAKIKDEYIIIVADCTGHGVPGAFMSMLGIALLNKIVNERSITEPANILNRLKIDILNSLRITGDEDDTRDGMDISIVKINHKKQELVFAGAMNSAFVLRKGEIHELEADKMPIGMHFNMTMPFGQVSYNFKRSDQLYLFSDGFADQFGGQNFKKFKLLRLKNLLLEIEKQTMESQKETLLEKFYEWKGNNDQIDDLLMIGIKL
jgi:PAS domain S-box-containing protein